MDKLYSSINISVTSINNCEDEPIHIPGSIQPGGFLLVINRENKNIILCSANTEDFLMQPPQYFLSKYHKDVLPDTLNNVIDSSPSANEGNQITPVTISLFNRFFDCFRRTSGSFIYIECLLTTESVQNNYGLFSWTNALLKAADRKTSLQELCSLVALNIRNIIGFDRVMIYRFDSEYNGHVYAESVDDGVESFIGLHYPATDIPKQARDLYLKNLVRLIPDVHYTAVPIVTLDAAYARPELIDLSDVQLRSVSPIHIQYLKNMGVGASMSISLVKDEKLWGLVACHHHTARHLSFFSQVQAYLLSQVLSSQIAVQETADAYRLSVSLDVPLKKLMEFLERTENFIELHFEKLHEVLQLVNATGAALIYKNKIYKNGIVPPDEFILSLQEWLVETSETNYNTHELKKDFIDAALYEDTSSGLLYYPVNKGSKSALFWFRESAGVQVTWAGNPTIQRETSPLTPRHSFKAWKEIKKGVSKDWQQPELNAAFRFSYLLQQHISHLLQREEELRNRKLNERLLKANKELENINWISTHDLKEPLRKIQIFASRIDTAQDVPRVEEIKLSIDKIRAAAGKMRQFIDDLLRYSKMSGADMAYETIDLNEMMAAVEKDFKEEKEQQIFEMNYTSLPLITASRFQLQQLFINLVDNAIKFRKEGEKQHITLRYEAITDTALSTDEKEKWHKITFADTGIGLTKTIADSIFDIFKRGHTNERFKGTGVGLSICRKIMENHGGKIFASGEENEGAVITMYFPRG